MTTSGSAHLIHGMRLLQVCLYLHAGITVNEVPHCIWCAVAQRGSEAAHTHIGGCGETYATLTPRMR